MGNDFICTVIHFHSETQCGVVNRGGRKSPVGMWVYHSHADISFILTDPDIHTVEDQFDRLTKCRKELQSEHLNALNRGASKAVVVAIEHQIRNDDQLIKILAKVILGKKQALPQRPEEAGKD